MKQTHSCTNQASLPANLIAFQPNILIPHTTLQVKDASAASPEDVASFYTSRGVDPTVSIPVQSNILIPLNCSLYYIKVLVIQTSTFRAVGPVYTLHTLLSA